jgi:hypothetical protein
LEAILLNFVSDIKIYINLAADGGGGSAIRLNDLGFNMAGQRRRKNINPLTTRVLTSLSCGHLATTALCKHPQMYLRVLGQASGLVKILNVTSSNT